MRTVALLGALAAAIVAALVLAPSGASVYSWSGAKMITAAPTPPGGGWVRSTPYYIDCPNECQRPFDANQSVVLAAHPTDQWIFLGWEIRTAAGPVVPNPCPGLGACTIATDADKTVIANFKPPFPGEQERTDAAGDDCCVLRVVVQGGQANVSSADGGIDCPTDCRQSYSGGTDVELNASEPGSWSDDRGNDICFGTECDFTINRNMRVTFVPGL